MTDAERTQVERDSHERAARCIDYMVAEALKAGKTTTANILKRGAVQIRLIVPWPGMVPKPPVSDLPAGGSR